MGAVNPARSQATEFLTEHTAIVQAALRVYIERMTEAGYQEATADPARRAAQDRSLVTTEGLRQSAELFEQQSTHAQAALDLLTDLE